VRGVEAAFGVEKQQQQQQQQQELQGMLTAHTQLSAQRPTASTPTTTHPTASPAVGKALVEHPIVASVHLTGSADTYNAIVWGGRDVPVSAGAS